MQAKRYQSSSVCSTTRPPRNMAKEPITQRHPLFRQYGADEIASIVLLNHDGEELSNIPGHRSEPEIKQMAQGLGLIGPVNLLARLNSGMTAGPVQIMIPSPRASSNSLFGASRLFGGNSDAPAHNSAPTNGREPSLVLESVQRLDRIATDTVATERARVDNERTYWRDLVEGEKEQARQREYAMQEKHEAQIAALREAHTTILEETRRALEDKMATMRTSHERTLTELKSMESAKVSHLASGAEEKVSLVREMSDQATRILEQSNQQTIATLKAQLETAMGRIRDLEQAREREASTAKDRYEDLRDRMSDEVNRLREEKSKAEQSRLELMMQSQKSSADEVRREVDRITQRYEAELKEARALNEAMRSRVDDLVGKVRDEATRAEIAILKEQANREPLKSERLLPILNALPMEQRSKLVGRAIASDLDIDLDDQEPEKPSLMDSLTTALTGIAAAGLAARSAPAAAAPVGAPAPGPAARTGGLGDSEEV